MERPQGILGLTRHYLELRWAGLSQRGRVLAVAGLMAVSFVGVAGARAAMGGCHGSCAARRHAAEMAAAAAASGEHTSCSHGH